MRKGLVFLTILVTGLLLVHPVSAVGPDHVESVMNTNSGLINDYVTHIIKDQWASDLYIATSEGLSVLDLQTKSLVANITFSPDEYRNYIFDLVSVGPGAYMATSAFDYPIMYYCRSFETPLENITRIYLPEYSVIPNSIAASSNSSGVTLFLGTNGVGLHVLPPVGNLRFYNISHGLVATSINTLLLAEIVTNTEWLFIGTDSGISVFDTSNSSFIPFNDLETIPFPVNTLLHDPIRDRLFVGTDNGLYVYQVEEDNIELEFSMTRDTYLVGQKIISLALDGNQLYIGTREGIQKYDLQKQSINSTWTLDTDSQMPSDIITSILIDYLWEDDPVLYAGTEGGGVAVIKVSYTPSGQELLLAYGPVIIIGLGILAAVVYCFTKNS